MHATALKAAKEQGVEYGREAKLAVDVKLYLQGRALEIHDVDNRLKDILDFLEGRMGGSMAVRKFAPIIQNDRQVHRVVITKSLPPKQSLGLGHASVLILSYRLLLIGRPSLRSTPNIDLHYISNSYPQ